jgi:hypothetical protein
MAGLAAGQTESLVIELQSCRHCRPRDKVFTEVRAILAETRGLRIGLRGYGSPDRIVAALFENRNATRRGEKQKAEL